MHKIESSGIKDKDAARLRASREQRTRYLNLFEIVVSLLTSIAFQEEPEADDATKAMLGDSIDDIDGKGTSLVTFLRDQVFRDYLIYGKVIGLTDAYPGKAANVTEQRQKGMRPYAELISPLSFVDWDIETADSARIGKFNACRHEYDVILPRKMTDEIVIQRQSNVLKLEGGKYSVDYYSGPQAKCDALGARIVGDGDRSNTWTLASSQPTDLTEIPISIIDSQSWMKDAAEEALRHYNLRSNRDNILYNQGWDQEFVTGVSAGQIESFSAAFNEYTKLFLPEGGTAFKLPATDAAAYEKAEAQAIDNVFKVGLNMLRQLPSDSGESQSALTMQQEKDNPYTMIESSIEEVEIFANDLMKNFALFSESNTKFKGQITFCDEIRQESTDMFIAVWQAFGNMFKGVKEIETPVAKQALLKLGLTDKELELANAVLDKAGIAKQELPARRPDLVAQALGTNANGQ